MTFGLNRGQLKNVLILAFIIFLTVEVTRELNNEQYYEQASLVKGGRVSGGKRGSGLVRGDSGAGGGDYVGGEYGAKFLKNEKDQLRREREDLEKEKEELKKLLWSAKVQNIMAGHDELSPLMQPLARTYAQDDPDLIQLVKEKYLLPPSTGKYNIDAVQDTSMGQAQEIRKILKNKKNGFFIECGALDGETRSNSLFLEKDNNWEGILVEADPVSLSKIRTKNRKAWLVPACLSTRRETMYVTYGAWSNIGRIVQATDENQAGLEEHHNLVNVTCVPLYSILMALGNPTVDYFSLDVEGSELAVLKTIPFDKVNIRTLSVEFFHLDEQGASNDLLKAYMEEQGYVYHSTVKARKNHANDYIFVKKTVKM